MRTSRVKSSIIASAVGGAIVFAAVAASSMTQPMPTAEIGVKGDMLAMPMKVNCVGDCSMPTDRIVAAFDTIADHDAELGLTTLTRVPVRKRRPETQNTHGRREPPFLFWPTQGCRPAWPKCTFFRCRDRFNPPHQGLRPLRFRPPRSPAPLIRRPHRRSC